MARMFRVSVGVATVAVVLGLGSGARAQRSAPAASPRAAAPADPSDTWGKHMSLGLDMGPGGVISTYTRDSSASDLLFYTAVRATYDIKPQWAGGLTLREWFLPGANRATMFGPIARWEPKSYEFGRLFIEAALGLTSTKYAWTYGFDVGGGIEWDIPDAPGFAIGPYLRYGAVINADERNGSDGHAWTVGGSFTYHFGRAAAGARATAGPRRTSGGAYKVSVPDSDRDGIGDDEDLCRDAPQGKHPDSFRPGCPENDEDGDGIPDVDDPCPVTAPGATPDPNRGGCPFTDSDNDGVGDSEDACPGKPGVFSPDPTHSGCPGKKAAPSENEAEPPRPQEPFDAPSTVKKRRVK
jgi:hypothetical protein